MASQILKQVEQRTKLAGSNRVELLLFKLDDSNDLFAINVFKVREVMRTPPIIGVPNADDRVIGLISIRDKAMSLIDLPYALGRMPQRCPQPEQRLTIITEFNRSVQGFLIHSVERIIHKSWDEMETPPEGLGGESTVTAITRYNDKVIQVLDVEKLLADITGMEEKIDVSSALKDMDLSRLPPIVCAEDSRSAQKFLQNIMEQIGVPYKIFPNGAEAWKYISSSDKCPLAVITDIEMPEMDGYTLIKKIREESKCGHITVASHSSMSGDFNKELVDKVGADRFFAKWDANKLTSFIQELVVRALKHEGEGKNDRV